MDSTKLLEHYLKICTEYPIISVEDPFSEDDWEGFVSAKRSLKGLRIVGDDLLVTRAENIEKAFEIDACNAAIIKINQVGTVSMAVDAINSAKVHGWLPNS